MGLTYCLKVPGHSGQYASRIMRCRGRPRMQSNITRRLGGSPVNHRSCAPCRHGRHTAPAPSFVRRIGWRETQFAQQCAQGDVHLHVGERRADTTVDAAAERNPRGRASAPVPTNRSGLNDAASGKLSSTSWASRILTIMLVSSGMTQSPNRIRVFVRRTAAVENRPGALHFPDRGLPQFRSAGVDFLGQPRQQLWMAAQPLQLPRPLIRRLSRDRRPARSATRRRCADPRSGHRSS